MAKVSTGGGGNTGAGRTQGRRNRKEVAETASSTKENGRQKRGGIKDMKTKESVFCKKGPCGLFSQTYFSIFRDLQDVHSFAPLQSQNFCKCSSGMLMIFIDEFEKLVFLIEFVVFRT